MFIKVAEAEAAAAATNVQQKHRPRVAKPRAASHQTAERSSGASASTAAPKRQGAHTEYQQGRAPNVATLAKSAATSARVANRVAALNPTRARAHNPRNLMHGASKHMPNSSFAVLFLSMGQMVGPCGLAPQVQKSVSGAATALGNRSIAKWIAALDSEHRLAA